MYCPKCATRTRSDWLFCARCGKNLSKGSSARTRPAKRALPLKRETKKVEAVAQGLNRRRSREELWAYYKLYVSDYEKSIGEEVTNRKPDNYCMQFTEFLGERIAITKSEEERQDLARWLKEIKIFNKKKWPSQGPSIDMDYRRTSFDRSTSGRPLKASKYAR